MQFQLDDGSIDWLGLGMFLFMWFVLAIGAGIYCQQQRERQTLLFILPASPIGDTSNPGE